MSDVEPDREARGGPGLPVAGTAMWGRAPVVVDDLDELRGPRSGVVVVPLHLEASTRAGFDVGDASRRRLLYEIVLQEAAGSQDLAAWVDRDHLIAMWPQLYLPRTVRAAWEQRHPALRDRGASVDVPRPR